MILRPFQGQAALQGKKALEEKRNTLIVAPTGAGKTIMLAGLVGLFNGIRSLVLQHRDELVSQNLGKFLKVNPGHSVSTFDAWGKSWDGKTTFAMVPTLCRSENLSTLPRFDLIVIDEAHHAAAEGYQKIIRKARDMNPACMVAGFTATPMRADNKGLRGTFDNCSYQITVKYLIDHGFLVPPTAFVVDVGLQEQLKNVRCTAADYNMMDVEKVMNHSVINDEVVRHWEEKAGDRKTIVFCSTVQHAVNVAASFESKGYSVEVLSGDTPKGERRAILRRLQTGETQVICNCAVLTEGFDEPTVSCIILLRPSSHKSVMIQMIGRGLRPPPVGFRKRDCVVLDFGISLINHGDIDAEVDLDGKGELSESESQEQEPKTCPDCEGEMPKQARTCPFCGYDFAEANRVYLTRIEMSEFDLINDSPFRWVDLFENGRCMIACGFDSFSIVASPDGENWYAIGKSPASNALMPLGEFAKNQAICRADDFLRENNKADTVKKSANWLNHPATMRQGQLLYGMGYYVETGPIGVSNFTKYTAAAHLNFRWNQRKIEEILGV